MEIGVDGVLVMGWWRRGKKKILTKKKKEEEEGEADIEIRMVWRRVLMECLWWVDREEEGKRFSRKEKKRRWRRKRGGDREEIEIKIEWRRRRRGSSEKKEGLGGGRWEIMKKVRENIILIKKCV